MQKRIRHCEPTGRANARPMTGSAKQSISPHKERMDCFVASLLAMTTHTLPHSRGAKRPSDAKNFRPLFRGRRECRAPDAPAAARGVVVSTRVSHHGHTGNTRHSPRNGFNSLFRALPGDRACLPPSPLRSLLPRNLMPASGHQDHTTSPYDCVPFVSRHQASTASRVLRP